MDASPGDFDADVLIVGAGPTGLTLAADLVSRGVSTLLIDRLAEGTNTSRAAVIHARTLEVLEPLGVTAHLVARGWPARRFTVRDRDRVLVPIDFAPLPTAYPYALMLSQAQTEAVLHQRLLELGGRVIRPSRLAAVAQDAGGVSATLDDGSVLRVRWLVGADGAHSLVREAAGIGFTGGSYAESFVLADVQLQAHPGLPRDEVMLFLSAAGMVVMAPLPAGLHRIVATVEGTAPERPDAGDVQALLDARGPVAVRAAVHGPVRWSSRFRLHHRVADAYRAGRVLLAGDAAHVHSPAGGQGMNAGILDATALAQALSETLESGQLAPLDAYGATRRPVAQQIVAFADRLTRLAHVSPALRGTRNALLRLLARSPRLRHRLAWQLSGLAYR